MGQIICPEEDLPIIDRYVIEDGPLIMGGLDLVPMSTSSNWLRSPSRMELFSNFIIVFFDPIKARRLCPDGSIAVNGLRRGRIVLHFTCSLVPRISIQSIEFNQGRLRVLNTYYQYHPYQSIAQISEPWPSYRCASGDERYTYTNYLLLLLQRWRNDADVLIDSSEEGSLVRNLINQAVVLATIGSPGCEPCLGSYTAQPESGIELAKDRYQLDIASWELAASEGLFEQAFKTYLATRTIIAIGEILTGNIPTNVMLPVGCDWLEYEIDVANQVIGNATLWMRYRNCDGVSYARYEDYYDGICFQVEWPEPDPKEEAEDVARKYEYVTYPPGSYPEKMPEDSEENRENSPVIRQWEYEYREGLSGQQGFVWEWGWCTKYRSYDWCNKTLASDFDRQEFAWYYTYPRYGVALGRIDDLDVNITPRSRGEEGDFPWFNRTLGGYGCHRYRLSGNSHIHTSSVQEGFVRIGQHINPLLLASYQSSHPRYNDSVVVAEPFKVVKRLWYAIAGSGRQWWRRTLVSVILQEGEECETIDNPPKYEEPKGGTYYVRGVIMYIKNLGGQFRSLLLTQVGIYTCASSPEEAKSRVEQWALNKLPANMRQNSASLTVQLVAKGECLIDNLT